MRSLLLCRHGETMWNLEGRLQGRGDSPLTARGLAQADALAALAASHGVKRIVSSPLGRALTTARRVAEACGASVETRDELMELSFGDCSTLTRDEYAVRFPSLRAERNAARWTTRWPGGESYADAVVRLERWLAETGVPWGDPPVAIVTHQSVGRALVHVLTRCTQEQALEHALAAGGALQVFEDGRLEPLTPLAPSEPHA